MLPQDVEELLIENVRAVPAVPFVLRELRKWWLPRRVSDDMII